VVTRVETPGGGSWNV